MRTYPECVPCILRATVQALHRAGVMEASIWRALQAAVAVCSAHDPSLPPIVLGGAVAEVVRPQAGVLDPYKEAKVKGNAQALSLYPHWVRQVRRSDRPLVAALQLAAAGNSLDLGIFGDGELDHALREALSLPLRARDLEAFLEELKRASTVLYIADNAGELVVDRILIEELLGMGKEVTLAVRGGPILNDATREDAAQVGLDRVVPVITTGAALPGVFLERGSPEFLEAFDRADVVLAKGMGNFEGLAEAPRPVFLLFRAKCRPISLEAGVGLGELVLCRGGEGVPAHEG